MEDEMRKVRYVLDKLAGDAELITVRDAEHAGLEKPGLYAIYVDTLDSLPAVFRDILRQRGSTLLYVGKAKDNLRK